MAAQPLLFSHQVFGNHLVGQIQNWDGGAVVIFQFHHSGVGVTLFKRENISDIRTSERVNGLIIITHHADIVVGTGEGLNHIELQGVGILVLIDHDVAVAQGLLFCHFGVAF